MISLSDGTATITLHKDLLWSDETDWNPVEQNFERTLTGAGIVQSGLRVGGRPITLGPEDDQSAPHTRAQVDALRNWAAVPGKQMVLTLGGLAYNVIFRHHDAGGALSAKKWIHFSDVQPGDIYLVTIRLMEI